MHDASDEVLFARYCTSGDVQALGQLFDRRAMDLFRLALYLGHDACEAEDLLQATFLSAIEGARQYDAKRPLMPWLTGILTNHARRSRRRERRGLVPEMLPQEAVSSPYLKAESNELHASLATALKSVPQPYRQVLTLHLEHGLTARAISGLLERPAGTVRSQVVRGLELLRRALPAGLASGLGLLLTPGHALAGVRVEVGGAGARLAPPTPAPQTGPAAPPRVTSVPTLPLLGLGLLGAIALPFWLQPSDASAAQAASRQDHAAAAAEQVQTVGGDELLRPDDTVAHRRPVTVDGESELAVRLRTATGEPLPRLPCHLIELGDEPELFLANSLRSQPRLLISDEDGWIRATDLESDRYCLWLIGSRQRLELRPPSGPREWTLPALRTVKGTIRTSDGAPVAGASVFASSTVGADGVGTPIAITDPDGAFAFSATPKRTYVWGSMTGHAKSPALPSDGATALDLVLGGPAATLLITVRTPSGQPAAGVAVGAFAPVDDAGPRAASFSSTGEDGRAEFGELAGGQLIVVARDKDGCSRRRPVMVPPGRLVEFELWLEAGASLRGRVTDSNRMPIRGRAVFAQTTALRPWSFDNSLHARLTYTDVDGRYELHGLSSEPTRIRLVTESHDRELCQQTVTLLPGESATLDFAVDGAQLDGRLLDQGGNPQPGWAVTAIPIGADGSLLKLHRFDTHTDAQGGFSIEVSERFQEFRLFASPASCPHPRVLHRACIDATPLDSPLHMVANAVDRAEAVGRLILPHGIPASAARMVLMRGDQSMHLSLADDGSFRTGPLPADRYQFVARSAEIGSFAWPLSIDAPPADGQPIDLGEVVWPTPGALTVLLADRRGNPTTARAWLQDDRGELVLPLDAAVPNLVAPGNYWLWAAGSTMAPQLHPVQIGAGESLFRELRADDGVPCAFEFPFASIDNVVDLNVELHVKILDHRGELVLRDDIRLEEHELFRWQQALRPGSYRLVCSTDWGGHAEKALEVTAKMPVLAMTIPLRTSHR